MSRVLRSALGSLVAVIMISSAFGQADVAGSKDYPGISRMPGYYISDYKESQFDSFAFTVTENGKEKQQTVEGRRFNFRYDLAPQKQLASDLQIVRNYQNAVRSAGGKVLRDSGTVDRDTTLRLAKGGSEIWVAISTRAHGGMYLVTIIEKQAMQQDVAVDAAAMATSIADSGSVAIYGIYFDTAKSELKPDSEPALAEIAKLLKQNPALKVYIVGHTDMVGEAAANMRLSQARAQSVVAALATKHGIAAARMIAFGAGPYAPVASNKTEDGRAKNRRVELVEIATN